MANRGERLNPLTEADRPRFDRLRRRLADLIPFMERLVACGINCDKQRDECNALQEFANLVEAEFLPPREDT